MTAPTLKKLLRVIDANKLKVDKDLVRLAFDFAALAHRGQMRLSGEPYLNHPLATAITLAELRLDQDTIIAGLVHDVPEDTNLTLKDVEKNFGRDVAHLVEGITKLGKLKYRGIERYIENLRKMFVAMAADIRTIFIKFADRLHNLQTLASLPQVKRERIARETLEIYAPIANRLGIWQLKGRLEDLSFQNLFPEEYNNLKAKLEENYSERKTLLKNLEAKIRDSLSRERIKITEISGRSKDLWSLHQKLLKHDYDLNQIYDIVALRVIVPTVADCYKTLGVIHGRWKPLPNRIKDYIAQPKPNGYQSLHTTIFTEEGKTVEIQIKTLQMHESAEYGIAAHWLYDEKGSIKAEMREFNWVKDLSRWRDEIKENEKYLESLKIDVFQDRIFVFTPKGDVIDLPESSTPIDFAYRIHTEIGNKAASARINNQIASLDTPLRSGDMVEIIIDKNRKGPNRDWLKSVKTSMARDKIKDNVPKTIWATIRNLTERRKN